MPVVKFSTKTFPLALALAIFCILPLASVRAADKDDDAAKVKSLFGANCKYCHGVDGGGTPVGQSMNAPDLRSEAVQKHTDAQLTDQITNGKGNMPPFKNSLAPDQIQSLVRYVRQLGAAKPPAQK